MQQNKLLLVVISSEVVEHKTGSVWCKNKGDGCTQTHCRKGYERALLLRICHLLCCILHRYSHNFLHMDSKNSSTFKNDVIVCVVRIRKLSMCIQCSQSIPKCTQRTSHEVNDKTQEGLHSTLSSSHLKM